MLRQPVASLALAVVALALAGGCAGNHISAARLPLEFAAPPVENMEAIDLSRLSHYTTNSELIDRGDVIDVSIVTNYSTLQAATAPVRVAENGTADVPLIGPVAVAGLETESAEQAIAAAAISRGIFQKPNVTVTMRRQRSNRVTVIGAVKTPGVYTLPRGSSSLLAALVSAGGLTDEATSEVEIRRSLAATQAPPAGAPPTGPNRTGTGTSRQASSPGLAITDSEPVPVLSGPANAVPPMVHQVNLARAAAEGDSVHPVGDGDVVLVGKRAPKPIYVIGLVARPGEYKMPPNQNLRVLDALALAGDRTLQLADKVVVIRHVPGREEPVLIDVSVGRAKENQADNLRLAPGDTVSVEETPVTAVARTFKEVFRFTVGGGFSVF